MAWRLGLIFLAGGAGCVARYGLTQAAIRLGAWGLPTGTLIVNALGCLAIGLLAVMLAGPWSVREEYRLAILVGFLGGFTTFSTYAYETLTMAQTGQMVMAMVYFILSNALGLLAVWLGIKLAGMVWTA